ncbi:N-acetyltransferase family protein [Nocardia sp. 004]|uniref:GNAT family N-acetyltransferase n=1 Tax=Nocardia sp. 004 TaxID=3385978 RepID=UPI0039A28661
MARSDFRYQATRFFDLSKGFDGIVAGEDRLGVLDDLQFFGTKLVLVEREHQHRGIPARQVGSVVVEELSDPVVSVPGADRVAALIDPICILYDAVFSGSPHFWDDSVQHRQAMRQLVSESDFGLTIAEAEGALVGFAYGHTLRNNLWWRGFRDPVPEQVTREWPGRTFAVIDIAVDDHHRRRGIGTQLMELLLHDRSEERATLAVVPAAVDAHVFYEQSGWQFVGRQDSPPDSGWLSPQFDIYVRALGK